LPGRGAAGRRACFVFAAVLPHDCFPHAMGRVAPAGAGSTFSTSKRYQKTPWGCAPWYPRQGRKKDMVLQNIPLLTFTEIPPFAGWLCANRTKPNQARLLPFWLCCSVPFLCYFCGCDPAGGWRGHVGEHSSPARCAVSEANLLFPQKQRASRRGHVGEHSSPARCARALAS